MNQEKAREFFSAYYEGTLEPGLRQTFEHRLQSDRQTQDEYRRFQETMEQLDTLKFEEIEVPSFLSDRIATRLEEAQTKRQARTPLWALWLKGLAVSGVAALAIFGAIRGINGLSGPGTASILPPSTEDVRKVDVNGRDIALRFQPSKTERLTIASGGATLKQIEINGGQEVVSALQNDHPTAAVFDIQTGDSKMLVAVPGTTRLQNATGNGTLKEFAAALAGFYRVPVRMEVADPSKAVSWNFDDPKALGAINASLPGSTYSAVELDNGVIELKER